MTINHVTKEKMENIVVASIALASLENGVRNIERVKNSTMIDLAKKYYHNVEKLPKKCELYYITTENFGTKKYSDYYHKCEVYQINENRNVRETDKSIVIESKYERKVIAKDKVVCFVW